MGLSVGLPIAIIGQVLTVIIFKEVMTRGAIYKFISFGFETTEKSLIIINLFQSVPITFITNVAN